MNMNAMISLKREEAKNSQNVNVNVEPKTSVYLSTDRIPLSESAVKSRDIEILPPPPEYPEVNEDGKNKIYYEQQIKKLQNEIEALNLMLKMIRDNPIFINKLVLVDDWVLMRFVDLLTDADDVQLDVEDLGSGCITHNKYRRVNAIYVIKNGETKNVKYAYPEVMKRLKEIGVNAKIVW
ncbi:protein of unknown function, DUF4106 family [Trichomonas vaginalis G3]|uniref:protein of unknown function, DUF4106 family n=1 Tax=Trichomonas vaginalis (strain ATCC PRA-98 / G3) TaxID=412133 RepID=UPI0021E5DB60|nr:protein of unknown function, DUF4106 family [Trichomonas vaginalis G3]KAI5506657.1 protein of unknown function, DUF4106 family [Trichomonas vaginalis G3]